MTRSTQRNLTFNRPTATRQLVTGYWHARPMSESNDSAADALRGSGLRATMARRAVIEVLRKMRKHMTVSEVIEALAATAAKFDKSTVYRVLSDLGGVGLVAESRLSPGDTVFEWISQSNHH
ncbi:MAG: transcriptional repressor, partial [Chloroflexi bacterium]|nr:transcriptional repressor [Chloroflexota bacterium]